ncbi:hypothetical protein IWQ61_008412 [Dispira simplex]|nr:hypothetical protein IWQ61_008412 [Dispira simplex]
MGENRRASERWHGSNHHERSSQRVKAHIPRAALDSSILHTVGHSPTGDESASVKTESDEEIVAYVMDDDERNDGRLTSPTNYGINSQRSPQTATNDEGCAEFNEYFSLAGLVPEPGASVDDLISQYGHAVERLKQAWEHQSHCLKQLKHLSRFIQRLTSILLDYQQLFHKATIVTPGVQVKDYSDTRSSDRESNGYNGREQKRASHGVIVDDPPLPIKQAKVMSPCTESQREEDGDRHYSVVKVDKTPPPESPLPMRSSSSGGLVPSRMSRLSTASTSSSPEPHSKVSRLPLVRKNTYRVLQNLSNDTVSKVMTRKPRSLLTREIGLTRPKRGKSTLDMMVTTSLDGTIQFWNTRHRKVITTFSVGPHDIQWPQDITWLDDKFLLMANSEKDGVPSSNQLGFLQLTNVDEHYLGYSFHSMRRAPHPRGTMVVEALECDDTAVRFATAGYDKQITLWEVGRSRDGRGLDINNTQQANWANRHTSAIHALTYVPHRQSILSGGADCKLFLQNVDRSLPSMDFKYTHRVNTITLNPVDANLALVSTSSTSRQMHMVDLRIPHPNVLLFGFQQDSNLVRYNFPSFSSDGTMVACGHNSDGGISLWDTRYVQLDKGPTQTLTLHSKRVVYPYFHPTDPCLIVLSVDGTVNFVNYKLALPNSH